MSSAVEPEDIRTLLKKYIAHQERYKHALRVVNRHKDLQQRLKTAFDAQHITQYDLRDDSYDASLAFRLITSSRVDTAALPEDLRRRYTRQVVMRKEYLTIRKAPASS